MTDYLEGKSLVVTVTSIGHPGRREGDVVKFRLVAGDTDIIISIRPELALDLAGDQGRGKAKIVIKAPKRPATQTNYLVSL